ncbi:MAG: thiol-disulfide isomerase [Bryobacteraceae bacterium]
MRVLLIALLAGTAFGATFNKDVLPILQQRCQECHRPGEIGPMPLLTYRQARPWAKAIRESVVTRKMPPWFADPRFGHYANDRSLTQAQIDTIAAWASNGAPEGDAKDRPANIDWPSRWAIGNPDAVFEMPQPFPIPATGAIEYQFLILPTHFTEDEWVQKVEVRPTAGDAVHHAVAYIRPPDSDWLRGRPIGVPFAEHSVTTSDILMVYTPGSNMDAWPDGMAKKIPAGSDIVLQMHYTTNGTAKTDQTRVGVVFAKAPPEKAVLTLQLNNTRFVIPPGDPDYKVEVSGTLPNDAILLSLFPHMHLRGSGFEYFMVDPKGHVEMLLKVNYYDFNWQLTYRLDPPLPLRAGTRLVANGYFDNSANNPRNPDPTAEVRYGEQSWEEMMVGFFDVAVDARLSKTDFFKRSGPR